MCIEYSMKKINFSVIHLLSKYLIAKSICLVLGISVVSLASTLKYVDFFI